MPDVSDTFELFSRGIAGRFLQTVVVVDDRAFLSAAQLSDDEESSAELLPPGPRGDSDESESSAARATGNARPYDLDAKVLNETFAKSGLVCTVLRPERDEDISTAVLSVARRADIVVLDWRLNDHGERATDLIKQVHAQDLEAVERLRLIAVYTAEPDLEGICGTLGSALSEAKSAPEVLTEDSSGSVALMLGNTRIVFLEKGTADAYQPNRLEEADLPNRLINEFATLAQGLLPMVILAAISAIRDETHRLIARLHGELDGAFLSHRFLIHYPEEAEEYIVDLIAAEIHAVLESHEVGENVAGAKAIQLYLQSQSADGREFSLPAKSGGEAQVVEVEKVMHLVREGLGGLQKLGSGGKDADLFRRIHHLLYRDEQEGRDRHREFARLSSLKREAFRVGAIPPDWRPRLRLGSIVQGADRLLVCIQPVCDSVRLTGRQPFMFAPLEENEKRFDIVVHRDDAGSMCLRIDARPHSIYMMSFGPSDACHYPRAERDDDGRLFFESADEPPARLEWIADLRTPVAQRLIHHIATRLSRVGLEEFEWQRKYSGSSE